MIHGRFMLVTVRLALILLLLSAAILVTYTFRVVFTSTATAQELIIDGHTYPPENEIDAVGCDEPGTNSDNHSTTDSANPAGLETEDPKPVLLPDGKLLP